MSVGAGQLERSVLERKTADELHAIATTLGGKPPSRAKKAEVIDLILRLAGVIEAAPASEPEAEAAEAAPTDPPVEASAAPARRRTPRASSPSEAPADAPTDDADVTDEPEPVAVSGNGRTGGEVRDRGARGRAGQPRPGQAAGESPAHEQQPHDQQGGREQQGREQPQRSHEQQGREQAQHEPSQHDQEQQRSREQQSHEQQGREQPQQSAEQHGREESQHEHDQQSRDQQQSHDQQSHDQQSDGEGGNRRRRRRGRDRDRGPERATDEQWQGEPVEVEGTLDLRDDGYGFLRLAGFLPSKDDVYVSVKQVRQFGLRRGDLVKGTSRPASRNEKNPALLRIDAVNGAEPDEARTRRRFEDLTPLFPDTRLRLEHAGDPYNMTSRIIDLLAPIGKGQRGLIVSPPKAGKTTVMKQIARAIETNDPEVELFVLLIDERPEEVTDMRRWLKRGQVAASTFDRPAEEHTMVAELALERAKRLVEEGKDVVIILDGITRLARAYNLAAPPTGRIMSGGIDTGALYPPKKFFGAARNVEEGGSLTILATALVDTGSRMDEVIFEEFKGTGNMELRLDRRTAERRIYPAIDVDGSSTRHEELLFDRKQLQQVWKLRRVLSAMGEGGPGAGLEMLIERLESFKSNEAFLAEVAKAPATG